MLANALPVIAWICLVLGLCGHAIWLATDGRRPDMPREIYDCMAGIVGQLFAGLLIISLAIWAPEHIRNFLMLAGFLAVFTPLRSELPQRNDQPYHPMTTIWQKAEKRYFLRSRLCVAAGASFGVLTLPENWENWVIWGSGAVVATNLSYYRTTRWGKKVDWRFMMPFFFSFIALVAGQFVLDPIPGDDIAIIAMLKTYLATILSVFLGSVILDLGADLLRIGNSARLLIRSGLSLARFGAMLVLLVVWRPDQQPSAAAWIICGALLLLELLVVLTPSPEPEVDMEPAPPGKVVVSA